MKEMSDQEFMFTELLEQLRTTAVKDSFHSFKTKAWERFQSLGLPTQKQEVFRYIKLRNLFSNAYSLPKLKSYAQDEILSCIYPECTRSFFVFVNGSFRPDLSNSSSLPKQLIAIKLNEATKTYGAFLNNQWTKSLKEESDPFVMLNAAMHSEGAFFYIPPKIFVGHPIQIVHLIDTNDEPFMIMPRVHIFMGAQSQASFITSQVIFSEKRSQAKAYAKPTPYWVNQVSEVAMEENAHLHFTQNACSNTDQGWYFDATRVTLKKNSNFKSVCVTTGGMTTRHDYRATMTGENAEVRLNGIWKLYDKREAHTNVLIDHQAPNCTSMQLFKGILADFSKSSFEGKILVRQAAQKTEAFQLNNNLLLNDHTQAFSKPNLEIFADDVKASHGATVGQLDKEHLFYLESRGFSEEEAKKLLVYSYCKEITNLLPLTSLRDIIS